MPGRSQAGRPRWNARRDNMATRNLHNREPAREHVVEPAVVVPPAKRLRAWGNNDAREALDIWVKEDSIPFWAGKRAEARGKPQVLVVHLGRNDLVRHSLRLIFKLVNQTFDYIREAFHDTLLVWVDILPCFNWKAPEAENGAIDRKRKQTNQLGHQVMRRTGGQVLHLDIDLKTKGFFRADRVHLSDVGLEMYLDGKRELLLAFC